MIEVEIGRKFGLCDVDPETGAEAAEITLHETNSGARSHAQKSVGRAEITWIQDAAGHDIGVIRGKTCFRIKTGIHVRMQRSIAGFPVPFTNLGDLFR